MKSNKSVKSNPVDSEFVGNEDLYSGVDSSKAGASESLGISASLSQCPGLFKEGRHKMAFLCAEELELEEEDIVDDESEYFSDDDEFEQNRGGGAFFCEGKHETQDEY